MGIKERQERERTATRDAILSAARELFVSQGFRNVSMRKIAERIEYSPAAIYGYFPNKDAIFFALAEEGFSLLAQFATRATASVADPLERLRRAMAAFYEFGRQHPQYFELMFLDRSVPSLAQDFERFRFFRQLTLAAEADIRACMERGEFSTRLDPAGALHVLWAGVLGATTVGLAERLDPVEDAGALARDVADAILAGFTTDRVCLTFVASDCPLHSPSATADAPGDAAADHAHQQAGRP